MRASQMCRTGKNPRARCATRVARRGSRAAIMCARPWPRHDRTLVDEGSWSSVLTGETTPFVIVFEPGIAVDSASSSYHIGRLRPSSIRDIAQDTRPIDPIPSMPFHEGRWLMSGPGAQSQTAVPSVSKDDPMPGPTAVRRTPVITLRASRVSVAFDCDIVATVIGLTERRRAMSTSQMSRSVPHIGSSLFTCGTCQKANCSPAHVWRDTR